MNVTLGTCYVCLQVKKPKKLRSMFSKDPDEELISDLIFEISGIKLSVYPGLPTQLCLKCIEQLNTAKSIRKSCIDSEKYWKNYLESKNDRIEVKLEPFETNLLNASEDQHTHLEDDGRLKVEISEYSNSEIFHTFDDNFDQFDNNDEEEELLVVLEDKKRVPRKKKELVTKDKRIKKEKEKPQSIGPFQVNFFGSRS